MTLGICKPARFLCPWDFPSKNIGVGSHFLLQGIFPTEGLNLGLLHYRRILYHLSQSNTNSECDTSATKASAISDCGKEGPISLWPAQIPSNLSNVVLGVIFKKDSWIVKSREIKSQGKHGGTGKVEASRMTEQREGKSINLSNHRQQDKLEHLRVTHRQVSGINEVTIKQCS